MCRLFPYFSSYFYIIPLPLGLFFISIQSVLVGAVGLILLDLITERHYPVLNEYTESFVAETQGTWTQLGVVVNAGYTLICLAFMLMGVVLFISSLGDTDDMVHKCVWGIFINAIFGLAMTLTLFVSCATEDSCLLSSVEWFSESTILVVLALTTAFWLYNACITHSYLEYKKKWE